MIFFLAFFLFFSLGFLVNCWIFYVCLNYWDIILYSRFGVCVHVKVLFIINLWRINKGEKQTNLKKVWKLFDQWKLNRIANLNLIPNLCSKCSINTKYNKSFTHTKYTTFASNTIEHLTHSYTHNSKLSYEPSQVRSWKANKLNSEHSLKANFRYLITSLWLQLLRFCYSFFSLNWDDYWSTKY